MDKFNKTVFDGSSTQRRETWIIFHVKYDAYNDRHSYREFITTVRDIENKVMDLVDAMNKVNHSHYPNMDEGDLDEDFYFYIKAPEMSVDLFVSNKCEDEPFYTSVYKVMHGE